MIRIKAIPQVITEMDDVGQIAERVIFGPETPIPGNAVRIECDGEFYTVWESGDV